MLEPAFIAQRPFEQRALVDILGRRLLKAGIQPEIVAEAQTLLLTTDNFLAVVDSGRQYLILAAGACRLATFNEMRQVAAVTPRSEQPMGVDLGPALAKVRELTEAARSFGWN